MPNSTLSSAPTGIRSPTRHVIVMTALNSSAPPDAGWRARCTGSTTRRSALDIGAARGHNSNYNAPVKAARRRPARLFDARLWAQPAVLPGERCAANREPEDCLKTVFHQATAAHGSASQPPVAGVLRLTLVYIFAGKRHRECVLGQSVEQSARSSDAGSSWATSRWTCCRCGRHERHQYRPPPGWAWQMGGLRCANCRQSARAGPPLSAARRRPAPGEGTGRVGS